MSTVMTLFLVIFGTPVLIAVLAILMGLLSDWMDY